jgi:hypothetical protein
MVSALTRVDHDWLVELLHKVSQSEWIFASKSFKVLYSKMVLAALEEMDGFGLAEEGLTSVASSQRIVYLLIGPWMLW